MIQSLKEFYGLVDELVKLWKNHSSFTNFGERLLDAKAGGFMPSEILGEISLVLKDFQSNENSPEAKKFEESVQSLLEFIEKSFRHGM